MIPRTAIVITPYFSPSPLAGVHRARHLAKHLPAFGWRPVVLHPASRHYGHTLDPSLLTLTPRDTELVPVGAVSERLTRPFGLGDISLRSFAQMARALDRVSQVEGPKVVLITAAPFYTMLLAGRAKRLGLPVVLDFQDPWVSAYGATRPALSKEGLSHRLAHWLEPKVLRQADWVTSVSEIQNQEMAARYPWLDVSRMSAIAIGGDPEDFDAANRGLASRLLHPDKINLSYVGAYWPAAERPVRLLLRAIGALQARLPTLADRLSFNFIGTGGLAGGKPVSELAAQAGLSHLIRELGERQPFLDALEAMRKSDGLIVFGSEDAHYTASKIYPVLMSGRPYVSLFRATSQAHELLGAAGGGRTVGFSLGQLDASFEYLVEALITLASAPESLGHADPLVYEAFTARSVTGKFADIFEKLTCA